MTDKIVGGRRDPAISQVSVSLSGEEDGHKRASLFQESGRNDRRGGVLAHFNYEKVDEESLANDVAADALYHFTGHYCQAYAPPGSEFEHKYTRREAILTLATSKDRVACDALYRALCAKTSDLLWGELTLQDVEDAKITARDTENTHSQTLVLLLAQHFAH